MIDSSRLRLLVLSGEALDVDEGGCVVLQLDVHVEIFMSINKYSYHSCGVPKLLKGVRGAQSGEVAGTLFLGLPAVAAASRARERGRAHNK